MTADRADDLALIEREEEFAKNASDKFVVGIWATRLLRLCALARAGLDARPREPTFRMADAGRFSGLSDIGARAIWRAMWDAYTGKGEK